MTSFHAIDFVLLEAAALLAEKQPVHVHPTMCTVILGHHGLSLQGVCTRKGSLRQWRSVNPSYHSEVSTRLSLMLVCITPQANTVHACLYSLGSYDVNLGASVKATPWQAANKVTLWPSWLIVDVCDSTSYVLCMHLISSGLDGSQCLWLLAEAEGCGLSFSSGKRRRVIPACIVYTCHRSEVRLVLYMLLGVRRDGM